MKRRNVYIEEAAWKAARANSFKHPAILGKQTANGTASAYGNLMIKVGLLIESPSCRNLEGVDYTEAELFIKKYRFR
jgi:hypothetical protein